MILFTDYCIKNYKETSLGILFDAAEFNSSTDNCYNGYGNKI